MQLNVAKCQQVCLDPGVTPVLDMQSGRSWLTFLPHANPISDLEKVIDSAMQSSAQMSKAASKAHQRLAIQNLICVQLVPKLFEPACSTIIC